MTGKSVGTFKFKSNRKIANKCIEFTVPALNAKGTCINSKLHGGDGKAAVYKVSQSNDAVKIAYYRAVVKNKWGKHDVEGSFWTKRALQAYCYPDEFKNEWGNSTYRKAMEKANAAINALSGTEVPEYFQCWVCYPTNDVQPFMVWRYDPLRITMQKTGRHAEARALDGYNSFEGITYELYKSDTASFSLKKKILPGLSAGEKLSGFRFSITGVYENAGTLSAGDVCRLPDPDVSPSHSGGYISWNGWQYDTGVISSINAAAQAADGVAPGYSRSFSISATNSGTEHWTEKEDHGHTEYIA